MALDIFFLEDIRNALLAANEASASTAEMAENPVALRDYRRGYRAALITVALAFGLSPTTVDGGDQRSLPARIGEVEYYE